MKCVICHGEDIRRMEVKEELILGNNVIYIPVKVLVCQTCGERYYDRRTMQFLEKIEEKIKKTTVKLKEIGKVLIYEEASHIA
jgi:YgiT-type zinc finger domain-containing protein